MSQPAEKLRVKFELAGDQVDRLRKLLTESGQLAEPSYIETRKSVYYDTNNHSLRDAAYSLRMQNCAESALQLIADANGAAYRYFEVIEWQQSPGPHATSLDEISPEILPSSLREKVGGMLHPVFTVEAEHKKYALAHGNSGITAIIADGIVKADNRSASFSEVQFWFGDGNPADFFSFILGVDESIPLRLAAKTEACRGYALIDGGSKKEAKRKTVKLERGMPSASAFRIIAHECLYQVVANEPAMSAGNAEALHQARIGLRRLRTVLSLFSPLCTDTQTPTIKAEIRWFAELLGPARDLDVFLSEVMLPLREQYRDEPGLVSLQRSYSAQRTKLYDRISQAANSVRFRSLALETAAWIETGLWALNQSEAAASARARPIELFAEEELTRRRKKVKKKGDGIAGLTPDERHSLRLHVKKLRYTSEFFLSLFPGRKKSKRAFLSSLKSLQTALGDVNDIAVRAGLKAEIITGKKPSRADAQKLQHRAFAAGLIIGHQRAKIESIVKMAERAYKDFLDAKPFWQGFETAKPAAQPTEKPRASSNQLDFELV
jgi:inorganic triphosphatase YgiF